MPGANVESIVGALIEREAQAAARLLEALEREYAALLVASPDALEAAVEEKRAGLERLESLARERAEHLRAAGFSPDLEGTRACLANGTKEARKMLETLETRLRACAWHNRRNGEIVQCSRQRVQAALAVLCGRPPQEPGYGPGGRHGEPPARLLASV